MYPRKRDGKRPPAIIGRMVLEVAAVEAAAVVEEASASLMDKPDNEGGSDPDRRPWQSES